MSDRTDDILDAKNNKIKEQAATIERYERVFRCDRQNERGWIAWAGPTLFRFFTDLVSALEYASEIKGRIYEQMASDSARQICEIEDQSATITAHEATIAELRKSNKKLKAQRDTAYGYGSDGGKPPWME